MKRQNILTVLFTLFMASFVYASENLDAFVGEWELKDSPFPQTIEFEKNPNANNGLLKPIDPKMRLYGYFIVDGNKLFKATKKEQDKKTNQMLYTLEEDGSLVFHNYMNGTTKTYIKIQK